MREVKRDVQVPPVTQVLNRVGMRRAGGLLCDAGSQTVLGHGVKRHPVTRYIPLVGGRRMRPVHAVLM